MNEKEFIVVFCVNFCFLLLPFWGFLILLLPICFFRHFVTPISVDYQYITSDQYDFKKKAYEALKDFKEIAGGYYPDFDTWDYPKGHFDETCMDAVPLSFYIITLSSSLEDAIRLAISHGDDGDTCEKVHQKIEND